MRRPALLFAVVSTLALPVLAQTRKTAAPEDHLPPNITELTGFGERAAWSPDDRRIAFMSKSFGDAFEIDLATRRIRLLTGHFPHAGFLRVHYLPSGDLFLIGARTFTDIRTTRARDQEMWVLKADASAPPTALDHKISEGVAVSRESTRIAWSNTHGQYPDLIPEGESVIYTCYRSPYADVFGIELATGRVTTYRKLPAEYNEVEGISPDGRWTLVESSRDQGGPETQNSSHIDIWKLALEPDSTDFVRLTRWGDYAGYKASNPVVSSDGKRMAFQSARNDEPAGVGHGIFILTLP